jgi:Zn-dependent peptidase ImmA (M78 family)
MSDAAALADRQPMAIAASYLQSAPVDLLSMSRELGLTVDMNADMPETLSGSIAKSASAPAGYHVMVNGHHSASRKRFTLAHEIAHYLLHRDLIGDGINDSAMYRSALSDEVEISANSLAATMLMPSDLVRRIYRAGLMHIAGLSKAFEVSEDAMRIRLKQLRLAP